MRILIVTDAWSPQINGVVTSHPQQIAELKRFGHTVDTITPDGFRTVPCPTYPEIRLALAPGRRVAQMIEDFAPDAVHIATEAPLGLAARRTACGSGARSPRPITRSFRNISMPAAACRSAVIYRWMRWFHGPVEGRDGRHAGHEEPPRGAWLHQSALWSRGVDTAMFRPGRAPRRFPASVRSSSTSDGSPWKRISRRSCRWTLPGTKWVVGDGPARAELERRFPDSEIPRHEDRRGTRVALPASRRLRLPQPHRYVRPRADSRRWRAARRSRPIRCQGRSTW